MNNPTTFSPFNFTPFRYGQPQTQAPYQYFQPNPKPQTPKRNGTFNTRNAMNPTSLPSNNVMNPWMSMFTSLDRKTSNTMPRTNNMPALFGRAVTSGFGSLPAEASTATNTPNMVNNDFALPLFGGGIVTGSTIPTTTSTVNNTNTLPLFGGGIVTGSTIPTTTSTVNNTNTLPIFGDVSTTSTTNSSPVVNNELEAITGLLIKALADSKAETAKALANAQIAAEKAAADAETAQTKADAEKANLEKALADSKGETTKAVSDAKIAADKAAADAETAQAKADAEKANLEKALADSKAETAKAIADSQIAYAKFAAEKATLEKDLSLAQNAADKAAADAQIAQTKADAEKANLEKALADSKGETTQAVSDAQIAADKAAADAKTAQAKADAEKATLENKLTEVLALVPPIAADQRSGYWGDPHVLDAESANNDFIVTGAGTYSLLKDKNIDLSAEHKLYDGWGIEVTNQVNLALGASNFVYNAYGNPTLAGVELVKDQAVTLPDGSTVTWNGTNKVTVTNANNGEYNLDMTVQTWGDVKYLDTYVNSTTKGVFSDGILPTGILGEGFDKDNEVRTKLNFGIDTYKVS